jgi:hypothetical protein
MSKEPRVNPTGDLPGMPPRDPVVGLGKTYLALKDDVDAAKEKMDAAGDELIKHMIDSDIREVNVDGVKIILGHIDAADVIKVKHPRGQTGNAGR